MLYVEVKWKRNRRWTGRGTSRLFKATVIDGSINECDYGNWDIENAADTLWEAVLRVIGDALYEMSSSGIKWESEE